MSRALKIGLVAIPLLAAGILQLKKRGRDEESKSKRKKEVKEVRRIFDQPEDEFFTDLVKKSACNVEMRKQRKTVIQKRKSISIQEYYQYLQQNFDCYQIVLHNEGHKEQKVNLFGGNEKLPLYAGLSTKENEQLLPDSEHWGSEAEAHLEWTSNQEVEPHVTISNNYEGTYEEFQHNPIRIKHTKVIVSGDNYLSPLKIIKKSITGKENKSTVSLNNYCSPQNGSKVLEIFDLEGQVIDGKTRWELLLQPKQSLTVLIHYKQLHINETILNTITDE